MTKHTPGPWIIHRGEIYGSINQDNPANVRLIAAAPEMLDAIERILEHYTRGLPDEVIEELEQLRRRVRALGSEVQT